MYLYVNVVLWTLIGGLGRSLRSQRGRFSTALRPNLAPRPLQIGGVRPTAPVTPKVSPVCKFESHFVTMLGHSRAPDSTPNSAELKGPGKLLGIRPEIFDFGPESGLKDSKTKPRIPGTVPTDRHTTIPNDPGPMSACFDDDPKLVNSEIAQPSPRSSLTSGQAGSAE